MARPKAIDWAAKRRKAGSNFVRQGLKTMDQPSVSNMALLAYRGVKGLRALVNSEEFVYDVAYAQTLVANTPVITPLNNMAQGDGQSLRTGNSILMKKLHRIEYNTSSQANTLIREILFYDKQQIADTAPGATDLLETGTPVSLYQKKSIGRFQILEDKIYYLNSAGNTGRVLRNTVHLNKHARYNDGAGSDIQKMGLYKLIVADTAANVTGTYRLFYHDN